MSERSSLSKAIFTVEQETRLSEIEARLKEIQGLKRPVLQEKAAKLEKMAVDEPDDTIVEMDDGYAEITKEESVLETEKERLSKLLDFANEVDDELGESIAGIEILSRAVPPELQRLLKMVFGGLLDTIEGLGEERERWLKWKAAMHFELFRAYVDVGFTDVQALELVKTQAATKRIFEGLPKIDLKFK